MDNIPYGDEFQSAVTNFNRRGIAKIAQDAKAMFWQMLASGTEPLFRVGLGERHFSGVQIVHGGLLWFSCFGVNIVIHECFPRLPEWYLIVGVIVTLLVLALYGMAVWDNSNHIKEIRAQKIPYHTKSRGKRRFEQNQEKQMRVWGFCVLLMSAPFTGIAFLISMWFTAILAKEQERMIYTNYLNHRDQEIESQFMEAALKGECDPEITWLYDSLPKTYDEETRSDITEAWCKGRPKSVVKKYQQTEKSAPVSQGHRPFIARPRRSAPAPETQPVATTKPGWKFKVLSPIGLVVLIVLSVITYQYFKKTRPAPQAQATVTPKPGPGQDANKPSIPAPQNQLLQTPSSGITAAEALQQQQQAAQIAENSRLALIAKQKQERESQINELNNIVGSQKLKVQEFSSNCVARVLANEEVIKQASFFRRSSLRNENNELYNLVRKSERQQNDVVAVFQKDLESFGMNPLANPVSVKVKWGQLLSMMEQDRSNITRDVIEFQTRMTNSSSGNAILQFKSK